MPGSESFLSTVAGQMYTGYDHTKRNESRFMFEDFTVIRSGRKTGRFLPGILPGAMAMLGVFLPERAVFLPILAVPGALRIFG